MRSQSKLILFCCLLVASYAATRKPPRAKSRIVGGSDAFQGEFPHQVSLQLGDRHFCGGAIVGDRWVLTAAHCATAGDLTVLAGKYNIKESEDSEQRIGVENVFVHDGYNGPVKPNDVALLKLSQPLQFNENVAPIGLPAPGSEPPSSAVLTGWGSVSPTEDKIVPEYLQKATVPIIDLHRCGQMFEAASPDQTFELSDSNICSGPGYAQLSSCNGDSGGPLVANGEVVGVTSWGAIPCGGDGPSAYTKVSSFTNWIAGVISNN